MKLLLIFLLSPICLLAQSDTLIAGQEYQIHYFKTGEISTIYPLLKGSKPQYWGTTKAFNKKGTVIFQSDISRMGLYSRVKYDYYPSGGIKSAHYFAHPDGGIQRTEIQYFFDESGDQTKKIDLSDDGFGPNLTETKKTELKGKHQREVRQDTREKAIVTYETRALIINDSKKKLKFKLKNLIEGEKNFCKVIIDAGDSLDLGTYTGEDGFDDVTTHFYLEHIRKSKKMGFGIRTEDTFPEGNLTKRTTTIHICYIREID